MNDLIEKQRLLALYIQLGKLAFTEIRNLAFGRTSLYQDAPKFPESVPTEKLLQNLFVAGQLAEAMHNLPTSYYNDYQQYLTLSNLCRFIEKNPQYQRLFHSVIAEIFQIHHQKLAEIDADFVATIVRKGLHEHK